MGFTSISEIDEVLQLYDSENEIRPGLKSVESEQLEESIDKPSKLTDKVDKKSEDYSIDESVISEDSIDTLDDFADIKILDELSKDYSKHTASYKEFHKQYMADTTTKSISQYYQEEEESNKWSWGDELVTYKERKEYVRTTMMNAIMGGSHNQVDPEIKDRYEFWKYSSHFNQLMSFMMFDKLGQG